MWVVKIGGSLQRSAELRLWLTQLSTHACGRVVIVPGGGLFADLIRSEQQRLGFSDRHAHRMALRAMDQYGLLMSGMEPNLVPVPDLESINRLLMERQVPIWLPSTVLDYEPAVEASWNVTSDSLAAWLACQLAIERLLLVKAAAIGSQPVSERQLIASGVLDSAFPQVRGEKLKQVRCVGAAAHRWVPHLLAETRQVGATVILSVG